MINNSYKSLSLDKKILAAMYIQVATKTLSLYEITNDKYQMGKKMDLKKKMSHSRQTL